MSSTTRRGVGVGEDLGWLRRLTSADAEQAWAEFLQSYASLLVQVIAVCERDPELRCDCFVYACEQLSRNRFRRLRRFKVAGPATFATWLRAVIRNLCVDWRRQRFGRRTTASQSPYLDNYFRQQPFPSHRGGCDDFAVDQVAGEGDENFQFVAELPAGSYLRSALFNEGSNTDVERLPDTRPHPEAMAGRREELLMLGRSLRRLSDRERLALALRFEQNLTLQEIARLTGLKNPQAVDRLLQEAIGRLRQFLTSPRNVYGKTHSASV